VSTNTLAQKGLAVKTDGILGPELTDWLQKPLSPRTNTSLPANLTAQAYLIAHLPPPDFVRGVLWYLPSSRDLITARHIIQYFLLKYNPAPQLLTFPEDFTIWLAATNSGVPSLLLVPNEYQTLALPEVKTVEQYTISLQIGQNIKPLELLRRLETAGFEPGPLPNNNGWFQKIGGQIIVTTNTENYNIIFDDNNISQIFKHNLATGLNDHPLTTITIWPRRLTPHPHTNLTNYLKSDFTLVGLPNQPNDLLGKIFPLNPLSKSSIFGSLPLFGGQWSECLNFIKQTELHQQKTVILTSEINTTKQSLAEIKDNISIFEIPENISNIITGFQDLISNLNIISDRELTGIKRPKSWVGLASFEELTIGDHLVHIDHGIGKFSGLTYQSLDNIKREYFTIDYADNDKLFVPVEHTDRLSRYLGSVNPKIERLHSASWFKTTRKVKQEAAALAQDLLKLYAKRTLSKLAPWQRHPEEELLSASFPYQLTPDQLRAWSEISADLDNTQPMDRLICGDVGFGKTELAIRAAWRATLNGAQVALLAPTTILAQQHFDTFTKRLSSLGIKIGLISRAQNSKSIKETLTELQQGSVDIIIGTHRLLARDVYFKNLGLLIIDEEQRFGVKQKEVLKNFKPGVHILSLSATPIPRTLNLAISQVRDLSLVATPPLGRQGVTTEFVAISDEVIARAINLEKKRQGQVYYLVRHITDIPKTEFRLKKIFPNLKLGVIHGRLDTKEVARTMHEFDDGQIDVLLATTIIENGLDLPNVNTIIIEEADKFGLADLYQLRGRVGRSTTQAYAYFFTNEKKTDLATKRLEALAQAPTLGGGLSIALRDLELRGAGAILGREQHGSVSAVGLHLYGQLLAQAVEELQTGTPIAPIPEVLLRLPLEGRISPDLIPTETKRIQIYQRLASIREPSELLIETTKILGRALNDEPADRLWQNLLTLLEIKLLAERARLQEITCTVENKIGKFIFRFLEKPSADNFNKLLNFDANWHKIESGWTNKHPLAAGAWIPWLKENLKILGK